MSLNRVKPWAIGALRYRFQNRVKPWAIRALRYRFCSLSRWGSLRHFRNEHKKPPFLGRFFMGELGGHP